MRPPRIELSAAPEATPAIQAIGVDSGPGQLDTLFFNFGGGLLTGAVSVAAAQFSGGAPWTLASTGTLLAGTTIEVLPGSMFTNAGVVVDPPVLVIDANATSGGFGTFDFARHQQR